MARMRVHELAKELETTNKELIDRILKLGIAVKNHMSALNDATVDKVRELYTGVSAEKVEEKRIGRAVIRRRKKVTEEEEMPPAAPAQEEAAPPTVGEQLPEAAAEAQPPPAEAPAEEAPPLVEEFPFKMQPQVVLPEAAPVEAELAPKLPPVAPVVKEPPIPAEEIAEPTEQEEASSLEPAHEKLVEPKMPAEKIAEAVSPVETIVPETEQEEAGPTEEAAETEEEEEAGARPKRAKKRRRKKTPKEEPARIIKLPEIMPEEPEEEEEALPPVAARIVVKEDLETREISRKKRPKTAESEKELEDRRIRGTRRKEVVERQDLYSKKELAAQDGRDKSKERGKPTLREVPKIEPAVAKPGKRRIKIDEAITVANLAKQMGIKAGELLRKLLYLGLPATINQSIDFDTASLLATEFEFEVESTTFEEEEILQVRVDRPEDLAIRPPVVTVMGHVDHGKTSLLDAIRDTNVIEGEAGGITQHIGAYFVKLESGEVVFLDTPGHEAFTSMRARGAKVTDLVILVVAADDGVMQQTVEAINHSKAANVPIIVAINKIDKPNANPDRVKRELADHGLIPGEWGGDATMVEISAKKRVAIDELLEMVLLQAEIMELRANPNKAARGWVIEAKLDKGRGPVATILIQEGTLRAGDIYVCGVHSGRVRNMFNDRGQRIESAGPSMPIEVIGLSGVPNAGDDFIVLTDEKQAKLVAENRLLKLRERELTRSTKVTLESLYDQIKVGEIKDLNVILKTDVHGSLEAITDSLLKLSTSEVKVNLIHSATGAITESDIMLASASNAIVIGFNVRADAKVTEIADQEKVDVRYYDVIYQILSDIRDAMVGMLEPVYQEHVIGRAEVRQTFHVPKIGTIAGCFVLDGRVERNAKVRVLRDQVVIYDGKISSLKRFKEDAKEVKSGFECGIGIENYNDLKMTDILEAYELQEVKPVLETEKEPRTGSKS
jgi:translation initiation factor IF-2